MSETVQCPECHEHQADLWDHEWGSRECVETTCGECGAPYILVRHVSVRYEAKRLSPGAKREP